MAKKKKIVTCSKATLDKAESRVIAYLKECYPDEKSSMFLAQKLKVPAYSLGRRLGSLGRQGILRCRHQGSRYFYTWVPEVEQSEQSENTNDADTTLYAVITEHNVLVMGTDKDLILNNLNADATQVIYLAEVTHQVHIKPTLEKL